MCSSDLNIKISRCALGNSWLDLFGYAAAANRLFIMKKEKSKRAIAMAKLRKERKETGLVEFRRHVKPKTKMALEKLADEMEGT